MAEQKTAQQQVREQYKVAENAAQNTLRAWTDLTSATSELAFDTFEKNLRYSQDVRAQAERATQETITSYRRMYEEGLKSWQAYVQGVNEIISRAANY